MSLFDIRRQKQETDTVLGGVGITSTAIETREMDLQHLRGAELVGIQGLGFEAQYRGFCHEDSNVREQDIISSDSGTTRYQVVFVEGLFNEHVEFLAKRVT